MSGEALKSSYDVVVVGGGLGGLTAGALLAQSGMSVLVVEKEAQPGGHARSLRKGSYTFDVALHLIMGCESTGRFGQGLIDAVLEHLGVRDRCEFVRVAPFYQARFPDFQMDVPLGREAFVEAHRNYFPDKAQKLDALMELCAQVHQETMQLPLVLGTRHWLTMPVKSPKVFRHANATAGDVIGQYLADRKLAAVYTTLWPYLGLPPSRVSFLYWAGMMAMYVDEGTYYCVGGFQRLVEAFVDGLTMHGGELVLGRRVEEIRVQDGRIQSVILDNGQVVDAGLILSNMDPRMTMENLNDGGQIWKSYGKKLKDLDLSVSVACMYLATDLDVTALGVPAETIRYGSWDTDQNFDVSTTDRVDSILITIPSLRDASLAPEGEQVVIVKMLVPSDLDEADDSKKRQYAEALLDTVEMVLPDLRHHITYMDGPENGSPHIQIIKTIYGWSAKPKQVGIRRLEMKTPVKGLYLVGQWTQPGHGVWSVVASGLKVARLVLDKDTSRGYLPLGL